MTIFGLDSFNLTEAELLTNENLVIHGSLYFHYFKDESILKPLNPKERGELIKQKLVESFEYIKTVFQLKDFELIGKTAEPRGIHVRLTAKELVALQTKSSHFIENFFVETIEGFSKKEPPKTPVFFTVKMLIGTFVEGEDYTKCAQEVEERLLLVMAKDFDEAEEKAIREIQEYCEVTYLNKYYQYVSFKLLSIEDIYKTTEETINSEGTEVYSKFKTKKPKKINS